MNIAAHYYLTTHTYYSTPSFKRHPGVLLRVRTIGSTYLSVPSC